jgi:hypothetical protein
MTRLIRRARLAALGAAIVAIGGCCSGMAVRNPGGAARAGDPPLSKKCLLEDVQIIAITANGKTIPKDARARKGVQVVIWVADADTLDIQFPNNPFPNSVRCSGRFCYSIEPPNGAAGFYDYTGTITRSGGSAMPIDPRIEIMN